MAIVLARPGNGLVVLCCGEAGTERLVLSTFDNGRPGPYMTS